MDDPNQELSAAGREGPIPLPAAGRLSRAGSGTCQPLQSCCSSNTAQTSLRWEEKEPQTEKKTPQEYFMLGQ